MAFLELYRQRALTIYGYLILGVQVELEPLQSAYLLLACRPFVPDMVSLCKVIFEERGGGGGSGEVAADTRRPLALLP